MKKENIVKFALEIINDTIRKNGAKEEVQKKLNDFKYYLETQGYSKNITNKLFEEMSQIISIVFAANEHLSLSSSKLIEIIDDEVNKYIIKSDSKEFSNSTHKTSFDYGIRKIEGCGSDIRITSSCGEIREKDGCSSDIRIASSCGETREKSGYGSDVSIASSCGGRTRGGC